MTTDIRDIPGFSASLRRLRRKPSVTTLAVLAFLLPVVLAAAFMAVRDGPAAQAIFGGRMSSTCIVAAIDDGRFPGRELSPHEAAVRRQCGIPGNRA